MTQAPDRINPLAAASQVDGEIAVRGLHASISIRRDQFGIAHIRAENEHDAWFGQGYAAAQDRLWQMEYDRLRATGRWAEAAGAVAVPADLLARRMQLGRAARADVEAMSVETRAMFEAYAAGINAFLDSGQPLPVEYQLTGVRPEPWQPWHSAALFKIRHTLMGVWQLKLTSARLLAMIGPEAYAKLDTRAPAGSPLILPPGGAITSLIEQAADELREAAAQLGFLAEAEAGSNSWAVHGSRTTTGMPVLCNDSHRALDVPSVYWQAHVSCPSFDVIGATFPGLPAFPHFGHNGAAGWNITHTSADYQDLYIEQFDPAEPSRYRTAAGWETAEQADETIRVRGGESVTVETWRTRHGPVVHGDPRSGWALALRYTATEPQFRGFEPLRPMLTATTVEELFESQREWVDPVNNLVAADTAGNTGYLTRGYLPVRASAAGRQLPAPGWTDEHEWTGRVPFERMPRAVNPAEGYIATANQRVIDGDDPYISHSFAPPSRAARLVELLDPRGPAAASQFTPAQLAAMQGDTVSVYARAWARLLGRSGPFSGAAEQARALLTGWDGDLRPESGAALLYAYLRRELARVLYEPVAGARAWEWLTSGELPSLDRLINQWLAHAVAALDGGDATPDGRPWRDLLPDALAAAWRAAVDGHGPDPAAWRWDRHHATNAKHPLAGVFPEQAATLNPARAAAGGDGDTLQCAAYGWGSRHDFDITALSVYRQVIDFSDVAGASFVVPGGVSGLTATAHAGDQLEYWRTHQRIPMHSTEAAVNGATAHTLSLRPE